jgi:hypothetical protein
MDQKLVKAGSEPLFPPVAKVYTKDEYFLDETLDMKLLTEYLKMSSEDPTLGEKDKFELQEAENLAIPIDIVEQSMPVTINSDGSSMLRDNRFSQSHDLKDILPDIKKIAAGGLGDAKVDREGGLAPETEPEQEEDDEIFGEPPIDPEKDDEFMMDNVVEISDDSGPTTRKEMIKYGKKKGKLQSALSKFGRKA